MRGTDALRRVLSAILGVVVCSVVPAAADGPLVVNVPAFYQGPLVIENRTFDATGPGQTALTLVWPLSPSVAETTVILRNITIRTGFSNGIVLINAWNARLDTINIYGAYDGHMANGIVLVGQSHDVRIDAATVMHAVTGLLVLDTAEGTTVRGSTFLGVDHGIYAVSSSPGRPWLVVADSHIAASRAGIVAINRKQVSIHDSLIYRHLRGYRPGDPWQGLVTTTSTDVAIRDVQIDCAPDAAQIYPGPAYAVMVGETLARSIYTHGCEP